MVARMEWTVRRAGPGDEAAAVEVVKEVYAEYGFAWDEADYHADLYDIASHYGPPSGFWLAEQARDDGSVWTGATVALVVQAPVPGEPGLVVRHEDDDHVAGSDCELKRLYVRPSARRTGLGARMLETVVAEARRQGLRQMEIWSDVVLTDAHRLYGRFGAEKVGERTLYEPEEFTEYGMVLKL